jgi:hypothetical protein
LAAQVDSEKHSRGRFWRVCENVGLMVRFFLFSAVVATLATAFTHSYFGERRLIGPLVKSNAGVMSRVLAKQVVRFAWHLTSLLWVGQALLLVRVANDPSSLDRAVIGGIGVLHLGAGLFDAVLTRGRHIGWPLLTAIGCFSLLSLV